MTEQIILDSDKVLRREMNKIRREQLLLRPWITHLQKGRKCDGLRWSAISFKALNDPELRKKYECKNVAHWKYKGVTRVQLLTCPPRSGVYCMAHLYSMCLWSIEEETRFNRWLRRYHPDLIGKVWAGLTTSSDK